MSLLVRRISRMQKIFGFAFVAEVINSSSLKIPSLRAWVAHRSFPLLLPPIDPFLVFFPPFSSSRCPAFSAKFCSVFLMRPEEYFLVRFFWSISFFFLGAIVRAPFLGFEVFDFFDTEAFLVSMELLSGPCAISSDQGIRISALYLRFHQRSSTISDVQSLGLSATKFRATRPKTFSNPFRRQDPYSLHLPQMGR